MTLDLLLIALAGAVGWLLSAFTTALWLGERGRRKDLQWLVNKERETEKVVVEGSDDPVIRAGEQAAEFDRKRLIDDLMERGGVTFEDAKKEAERVLNEVHHTAKRGW